MTRPELMMLLRRIAAGFPMVASELLNAAVGLGEGERARREAAKPVRKASAKRKGS